MEANQHSHGVTDPGHMHPLTIDGANPAQLIVDESYMGDHLYHPQNCRCSVRAIHAQVLDQAARAESEYMLTVKLDPEAVEQLMEEMRNTIAAALGMKASRLFGCEPEPGTVSHEYRALMTVAAFPHTPE